MLFFFFFFLSFFPLVISFKKLVEYESARKVISLERRAWKPWACYLNFLYCERIKKRKILFTVIFRWEYNNARIAVQINLIIRSNSIGTKCECRRDIILPVGYFEIKISSNCSIYFHKLPSLDSTFFPLCKFIQVSLNQPDYFRIVDSTSKLYDTIFIFFPWNRNRNQWNEP